MACDSNPNKRPSDDAGESLDQKKMRQSFDNGLPIESEPITVIIGNTDDKFYIHEHLLTSDSEFFRDALGKEWKEKEDRTVLLPGADLDDFRLYAAWLYNGKIHNKKKHNNLVADKDVPGCVFTRLLSCYGLGDFLQSRDFQDATIDAIAEASLPSTYERLNFPRYIYLNSAKESLHRKLCRDFLIHLWEPDVEQIQKFDLPLEFLEDFLMDVCAMVRGTGTIRNIYRLSEDLRGCKYHEHTRFKTPCYKIKFGI